MGVRYKGLKDIEDKFKEILKILLNSTETYEINIREEKEDDIYKNVDIKIRKIDD